MSRATADAALVALPQEGVFREPFPTNGCALPAYYAVVNGQKVAAMQPDGELLTETEARLYLDWFVRMVKAGTRRCPPFTLVSDAPLPVAPPAQESAAGPAPAARPRHLHPVR